MKVTDKHTLDVAIPKFIGPLVSGHPMDVRRCLVIHYTEGLTAQSSIDYWNEPKQRHDDIGAHIIIDRDGLIYQCRPFNRTISHAGVSRWYDSTAHITREWCNQFSIGIELANAGDENPVIQKAAKLKGYAGTRIAAHRNGGKETLWEAYPAEQIRALTEVCKTLCDRYHLDDITGHDCIAPERKRDPGPSFPMLKLRQDCGFTGLPYVNRLGEKRGEGQGQ
jgi:N-acetylmuramoyl-L-alanine amidase